MDDPEAMAQTLALFDADHHPVFVDVADLEGRDFMHVQPPRTFVGSHGDGGLDGIVIGMKPIGSAVD